MLTPLEAYGRDPAGAAMAVSECETEGVDRELVARVAELLRERNLIDASLAGIVGRPPVSGHVGEWIASQIFDIELEQSASAAGIDGRFRSGVLQGRTVNVKWYLKQEGLLDRSASQVLDFLSGVGQAALVVGVLARWCAGVVHRCGVICSTRRGCTRSRLSLAL